MKYILIGIVVVGILYSIVQAIGLMLVLALMKKREERLDSMENGNAESAASAKEEQV